MDKKMVLFVVISFVVLLGWDYLFTTKPVITSKEFSKTSSVSAKPAAPEEASAKKAMAQPALQNFATTEIETGFFKGGMVKETGFFRRIFLRNYFLGKERKDLVDVFLKGTVDVYDAVYINDQPHRVTYSEMKSSDTEKEQVFVFRGKVGEVNILKKVAVDKNSYLGSITFEINSETDATMKVSVATVISLPFSGEDVSKEGNPLPGFYAKKAFEVPSERQLKNGFKLDNVLYGGVSERYFALFFVDPAQKTTIDSTLREGRTDTIITFLETGLGAGKSAKAELKYFAGPKDPAILAPLGHELVKAVDYGFFHFIAKPLLMIMNFFYSFSKNYGISIILLTLLIKLAFYPLSQKSYRSMKELQKLQPKLEEIRKKYAKDKEALNREMMQLYKRHGVNPLSGCLPMLVQIPFFIALYQALMSAIELRHAPFFLWITDLSAQDPYYVTPIIMGATMLIQQIITPSSGDPIQKKMMYILPVVFTFMFLSFPSGLVLYWLINNVFSIAQQFYTMQKQEA
jgi:YidC/Oxa1 family membrane protein insertase